MSFYFILGANNEVVPVDTFDAYFEWLDRERKARGQDAPIATLQVARDVFGDRPDCVSTVFLGLDHGWGAGPPQVFETMLFTNDDLDESLWRYSTWEEAVTGHNRVVAEQLGHANANVTAKTYAHVAPESAALAVSVLDEAVKR